MSAVKQWADSVGIPVHLDGARIFNAAQALGVSVDKTAANVTSVQFCLSKVRSEQMLHDYDALLHAMFVGLSAPADDQHAETL